MGLSTAWEDFVEQSLARIELKLEVVMGLVKVSQEDLDAIDQQLDESVAALTEKIEALDLPEGDLTALKEDLENLKGLHTANVSSEPV